LRTAKRTSAALTIYVGVVRVAVEKRAPHTRQRGMPTNLETAPCSCGSPVCVELHRRLRALPHPHRNLARCMEMNQTNTAARYKSACLAFSSLKFGPTICIAVHHYDDHCLAEDLSAVEQTTISNPDPDSSVKYRVDSGNYAETKRRPSLPARLRDAALPEGFILYHTAPTLSLMASEARVLKLEQQFSSKTAAPLTPVSRAQHTIALEEQTARLKRSRDAVANLDADAKELLKQDILEEIGLGDEGVADLRAALERVAELESENAQLREESKTSFSMANMADIEFWLHQHATDPKSCMAQFGIPHPRQLFHFCKIVRLLFRDLDDGDDPSQQCRLDLSDKLLTLAVKCTPSSERQAIQARRAGCGRCATLTVLQEQLLTLAINRNGYHLLSLQPIVNVSKSILSRAQLRHLPRFALVGRVLSNLPLDEAAWFWLAPLKAESGPNPTALAIVDGKDVMVDEARNDYMRHRMLRSNKVEHAAVRGLTLVHATGLLVGVTDPVPARASEPEIMAAFPRIWQRVPAKVSVYGDRAYKFAFARFNGSTVLIPAFKPKEGKQMSAKGADDSRFNAQQRYIVEVSNSRYANYQAARGIVSRSDLHNLENRWHMSWGLQVFMAPLQQPRRRSFPTLLSMWHYAMYKCYHEVRVLVSSTANQIMRWVVVHIGPVASGFRLVVVHSDIVEAQGPASDGVFYVYL